MDKSRLRQSVIAEIKSFSENERHTYEEKIRDRLISSNLWRNAKTIGITIANGFEWDTAEIIKIAWKQGKRVCAPKCLPKYKEMHFYQIESFEQLEVVYYNLLEPKPTETIKIDKDMIDLLIVPGVVFNNEGYRIGFGGGYYDRFLPDFKNETVSILHSKQLVKDLPIEKHDIAVKHLLTEEGFI